MTFASKAGTLKNDYNIFKKYCSTTHLYDFQIFCDLFKISGEPRFNYVATRSTESGSAGFLIPPALRERKALTIFNNNLYLLKINVFNPGSRWITLVKINGRRLISCIPSVSTHGEIQWLAKFIDWQNEFNKTNN